MSEVKQKTSCIEYDSNNSGGHWWLSDEDWFNLEKAGWVVKWYKDYPSDYRRLDSEGRWLGALACKAYRVGLSYHYAILEWAQITNQDAYADGCDCCGPPHNFYEDFVEDLHY